MSKADGQREELIASMAARLAALTEEERKQHNNAQIAESDRQHSAFRAAFREGGCYICHRPLGEFVEKDPCLHWFLRPEGVRKRHYPLVADKFGMMAIQSWIRWVANEGEWAKNIADTADADHLVQVTAGYGDYEWSISCSRADFNGHAGRNSSFPHYHLQMKIKGRPFISYNDFHLPVHHEEAILLRAMEVSGAKSKFAHGESFDDLMAAVDPQWVVDLPKTTADPKNAHFSMHTFIMADEGTAISGDAIYDLVQKARAKGVSVASLADSVPNASARTLITEGPGVLAPAPREGGRGSKR